MNTPRGGPPPPHPFVLGHCGRALDSWRSWRSWRSWCLCLQTWKPGDSRQMFFDSANSYLFKRIGSTNMGEIAAGISGGSTGGTSSRQYAKKIAKVSKNPPQSLQNRALEPPKLILEPFKTPFQKTSNLRTLLGSTIPSFLKLKWPTWFHLGGPRPSQIEAKTSKTRC